MKASRRFQILLSFSLFILISGCGNAQSDSSVPAAVKKVEKKIVTPDLKPVLDSVAFKILLQLMKLTSRNLKKSNRHDLIVWKSFEII
jgi:hypothetical protein